MKAHWMKFRTFLTLFLLQIPVFLFAQDWFPLAGGQVHNFRHNQEDVISVSIWADSSEVMGTDSVLYLNRTPKRLTGCLNISFLAQCDTCCWDKNGANFLMREMVWKPGGVAEFRSPDSLRLETAVGVGGSFSFNTSGSVLATVISADTGRVFGQPDSIKTYLLTPGNDTLQLSKAHGILRFPGNSGGSDEYWLTGLEQPDLGETVPKFHDFFDLRPGDLFETQQYEYTGGTPMDYRSNEYQTKFAIDSVDNQVDSIRFWASGINIHTFGVRDYYGNTIRNTSRQPNFIGAFVQHDSSNHFTNLYPGQLINVKAIMHDYFFNQPFSFSNSSDPPLFDVVRLRRDSTGKIAKYLPQGEAFSQMTELSPGNDTLLEGSFNGALFRLAMEYREGVGLWSYICDQFEAYADYEQLAYAKEGMDTVGSFTDDGVLLLLERENSPPEVRFFPNPVEHALNIVCFEELTGEVQIIDLQGRITNKSPINQRKTQIPFSHLPSGIYVVRILTSNGQAQARIIKK